MIRNVPILKVSDLRREKGSTALRIYQYFIIQWIRLKPVLRSQNPQKTRNHDAIPTKNPLIFKFVLKDLWSPNYILLLDFNNRDPRPWLKNNMLDV